MLKCRQVVLIATAATSQMTFNTGVDHFFNLYVTGFQVNNPSADLFRCEITFGQERAQPVISNGAQGGAVYFPAGAAGAITYHDFNSPIPLLTDTEATGSTLQQVTLNFTDSAGAPVTFTRAVIFARLEMAPKDKRYLLQPKRESFWNTHDQIGFGGFAVQ